MSERSEAELRSLLDWATNGHSCRASTQSWTRPDTADPDCRGCVSGLQLLVLAQTGRSASDGVRVAVQRMRDYGITTAVLDQWERSAQSDAGEDKAWAVNPRAILDIIPVLRAALATPPPAPDGERCVECGQEADNPTHGGHGYWTGPIHPYIPDDTPPTPAAAVSVSSLDALMAGS